MNTKQTIGTLAALGGLSALVALLSGLPAAKADDVSDLRANNQVLQQRIEQLAQVGTAKPQLPAGTAALGGSFPRSFLIPGTDTSLQVGGYVDLSAAYYVQGGGPNSNGSTPPGTGGALAAGLPLHQQHAVGAVGVPFFNAASRQAGWYRMQANESRVYFETRTPTVYGEALTHVEFDFGGCAGAGSNVDCSGENRSTNSWLPRLRLAYGTLGGFMAGQNWVPGNDLAASPEIFDFFGDVGQWGFARTPQIGYKTELPWLPNGPTIGVYLVQPNGALATPLGGIQSDTALINNPAGVGGLLNGDVANLAFNPLKDPFPDGAMVINWEQPWGHFQLHGMLRDMEMQDTHVDKSYLGYGGGFSGAVHPAWFGWTKDNLGFQAFAGEGLSHWGNNWTGGDTNTTQALASNYGLVGAGCTVAGVGCYGNAVVGGASTTANAALVRATTVPAWGGEINYQHWWTPTLRSTATFGIGHQELSKALIAPFGATAANFNYNTELTTAHLNLIWSPVAFINTGFEYTYDHRFTMWHQRGDGHIIDFDFLVKF